MLAIVKTRFFLAPLAQRAVLAFGIPLDGNGGGEGRGGGKKERMPLCRARAALCCKLEINHRCSDSKLFKFHSNDYPHLA